MKNSLIILACLIFGVVLGVTKKLPDLFIHTDFSMIALYFLMFMVGIGIGADKNSWTVLRTMKLRIFLVPLGVVAGTFAGTSLIWLILPGFQLKEVLAVGAGFGYYSLSSLFITQLSGETLGVIALLSNLMRELFTLLATPLLVRYLGKLAGIASGGATSMDTTLPVISKYSGKEWAIISVFSGVVLTILVPFLVTFILKFL